MAKLQKVKVTRRAAIQRINRKLKPDMEQLCAARGERAQLDLGDYYVVDFQRNAVMQMHVDVEAMARQLGVLKEWEQVDNP